MLKGAYSKKPGKTVSKLVKIQWLAHVVSQFRPSVYIITRAGQGFHAIVNSPDLLRVRCIKRSTSCGLGWLVVYYSMRMSYV